MHYVKTTLNDRYADLTKFVNNIPNSFEAIESIIQNSRNDIRDCTVGNHRLVIKSFKGMYFTNQIAYSLFRKSKAERSYTNSLKLIEKGFHVPDPVAFIDCHQYFFLTQSFFISRYHAHTHFNTMVKDLGQREKFLSSFARFTFRLHCAGIYHDDYSNGNILCNQSGSGTIVFQLVDLNRVRFMDVSYSQGIKSMSKLSLSKEEFEFLIRGYSALWGRSMSDELMTLHKIRTSRSRFSAWRKWAKSIFFASRIKTESR